MRPGTVLPNPFGETNDRVQTQPRGAGGTLNPDLVEQAGPVDPEVAVLSIQNADGRPLAMLANYGAHFAGGFRFGDVSADYWGYFSTCIGRLLQAEEQDPPFVGIMSTGTNGDVTTADYSKPPIPRRPPYAAMREIGEHLAGEAFRVYQGITHRDHIRLVMLERELEVGIRRPDAKRLAWARDVWTKAHDKKGTYSRSEIYAREALFLHDSPPTIRLKLQVLRIGDLGIVAILSEVFAETGLAIKQHSPLKPTFTIGFANGYYGYLPTARQQELGGYETWPARSVSLEIAAEAKIRATVLEMLREI